MKTNNLKAIILLAAIVVALFSCKKSDDKPNTGNDNNNTIPVPEFKWTGTQTVNSEIQFVNTSKNADSYKWNFGDGQTSMSANPGKIKYNAEGVYEVTLTAVKGDRRMVSQQLIYIAPADDPSPFFTFTFKDGKDYAPATVQFNNQTVGAPSYKWVINGQTYYDKNPQYIFNTPGDYVVTLTIVSNGEEYTHGNTVKVVANQNPQAAFVLAYHPYPYKVGEAIQLVNQSKNSDAWEWTFGTGGPAASTDQHPEVKFANAGKYDVTLVAKKGNQRSAPKTISIKIEP